MTTHCSNCKKEIEKSDLMHTDLRGRPLCEECSKGLRQVLRGITFIGGRQLI